MNKYLKHYNQEQQIKYLELKTMIDVMLLKLSDSQKHESDEYYSDSFDSIVLLSTQKKYNLDFS